MPPSVTARFLAGMLIISLGALLGARELLVTESVRPDAAQMVDAGKRAAEWFRLIEQMKAEDGISNELTPEVPYAGMMGTEWSEITTTQGSLEAKRTAAQPAFSALLVRLLHDAGVDSSMRVGVIVSGSFPSLAIATLAALQTIGADVVLISSLGSSSFGANQPGATWLDMEEWLHTDGGLRYRSALVTMGAEGDTGGGLEEEGIAILRATAARHGRTLRTEGSFADAVHAKTALLLGAQIGFLVNIGGNQTSLGTCPHAPILPSGYTVHGSDCQDPGRGVIERCAERGIPFLHLLNIQSIAVRYGIPLSPSSGDESGYARIVMDTSVLRAPLLFLIIGLFVLLFSRRFNPLGSGRSK